MNHKRKRAKHQRAGCLMCKPHKRSGYRRWVHVRGRKGFIPVRGKDTPKGEKEEAWE